MPIAILIGLGAGLASALLFASAATGTLVGLLVLFFLSPLPVAIAGLGWGWGAAAIAAVTAALALAGLRVPEAGLVHALVIGAPTAVLSHFVLLGRPLDSQEPGAPPSLEWYPLGRVIAIAAGWAGVLGAIGLLAHGTDLESIQKSLRTFLGRIVEAGGLPIGAPGKGVTERDVTAFVNLMTQIMPSAVAAMWMMLACLNLWLGGLTTRLSGRLARPWPDLSALQLPREMPIAFAASIALSFLPGIAGLLATGFSGAIMFAYMLVGMAIVHRVTMGSQLRVLVLSALYTSLFILPPFSSFFVAMLGLAEPFLPWRRPPPAQGTNS